MKTTRDVDDPEAPRFEWIAQPMGARVDLEDKDVVYAILDVRDPFAP